MMTTPSAESSVRATEMPLPKRFWKRSKSGLNRYVETAATTTRMKYPRRKYAPNPSASTVAMASARFWVAVKSVVMGTG